MVVLLAQIGMGLSPKQDVYFALNQVLGNGLMGKNL